MIIASNGQLKYNLNDEEETQKNIFIFEFSELWWFNESNKLSVYKEK